jgi:hypothetical protein
MLYVLTAACFAAFVFCLRKFNKSNYHTDGWWLAGLMCFFIAFIAFGICSYTSYYINHGPKRILCVDQTSKEVVSTVSKGGIVVHSNNSFEYLDQDGGRVFVVGLSCIITEP